MCTIGYHKKLNILFKNRDKYDPTEEVLSVKPGIIAVKTESSDYYCSGINQHGCAFATTAVNTPYWTYLSSQGKVEEAAQQHKKENEGLVNPSIVISKLFPDITNAREWLDKLINSGQRFMGYNMLLVDRATVLHVEIYNDQYHVNEIEGSVSVTNHFKTLHHGPEKVKDYPSSYERLSVSTNYVNNFISLEDVFDALGGIKEDLSEDGQLWREGRFYTVSSSVMDLDTKALYYKTKPSEQYHRVASEIPPKGAERAVLEMSRYIDLPTYHKIERGHPFYIEMLEEINKQIADIVPGNTQDNKLNVLEVGAGTGLCTEELLKHDHIALSCLELDSKCCEILLDHGDASRFKVIQGDAVEYCQPNQFDVLVSTFAHDHIHYDNRFAFSMNIFNNLKPGGRYIMGGEILPYYSNNTERKKALFKYHNFIIDLALKDNRVQLCELENNALKSGLDMLGDFKRHEAMFEEEMDVSGLQLLSKTKMGPLDRDDVGGVYVYVYEKPLEN